MTKSDDNLVGKRIWLDYFDQNTKFEQAYTPQACEVLRRMMSVDGADDWYLVKLNKAFTYEGFEYANLLIRSRWAGCKIGGKQETSVFILLAPDADRLSNPFELDTSLYLAWGMASPDSAESRSSTSKRQEAANIMESIRSILFCDWDPIGVNDLAPNDEYDAYIGGVYRLLVSGISEAELSEHLRQLEITKMEMVTSQEHRKLVAEKLLRLNLA
jgi:hypothetical protein